jgi:hypothetical protein
MKRITKVKMCWSILAIILLAFPNKSFSQTANLGILTSFEGFTGNGGVSNTGGTINGDVGTHIGVVSGGNNGNIYVADAVTDQARKDLMRLYIHLNDKFVDFPGTHAAAFGGGETLTPGVYSIAAAGSIGTILNLDGQGDPNAFFIIKFAGAFTVGAGATVNLINGAQSCNVFYVAAGAISVAADAHIKGTLFSKGGAVGLGAGVILEGRMLTTAGAITLGIGSSASQPPCTSTIPIFCEAGCTPAAAVDVLGTASDFVLFTSSGAVANTGTSGVNGNLGTNSGTISGYSTGINIGNEEIANALTASAALDLNIAYDALMALPVSGIHAAAFGAGEILPPGVYDMAAGSLGGTITLDGGGDPDAIFVMRFAGAFNVAAGVKIILANGAKRCNIFWIGGANVTTGAVNIGANSIVKGNFLSHGGACNSGVSVFLAGRQLSTLGAVNTNEAILYINPECVTSSPIGSTLPIELVSFTSKCNNQNVELKWVTASEINNDYFSIERSINGIIWQLVTKVVGAGNSTSINNYSFIDIARYNDISYYRLKQTDFDGKYKYSAIIAIDKCGEEITEFAVFPNPTKEALNIYYGGDKSQIISISISNVLGKMVYYSNIYEEKIVFDNKLNGIYFLHVNLASENIIKTFVVID